MRNREANGYADRDKRQHSLPVHVITSTSVMQGRMFCKYVDDRSLLPDSPGSRKHSKAVAVELIHRVLARTRQRMKHDPFRWTIFRRERASADWLHARAFQDRVHPEMRHRWPSALRRPVAAWNRGPPLRSFPHNPSPATKQEAFAL